MLLTSLASVVAEKLAGASLKPAVDLLERVLSDRKAFAFAADALRLKYEAAVRPSDYDFIVENFLLTKQDFVDFFREPHARGSHDLAAFVKGRLIERASLWRHNRPDAELYAAMIDDFYDVYLRYYVTTDPMLTSLQLTSQAEDTLALVGELKQSLDALREALGIDADQEFDVRASMQVLLRVAGVAYSVVEESDSYVDLSFTDPTSTLPASSYAHIARGALEREAIERLKERALSQGVGYSHILAICTEPSEQVVADGRRRGVTVYSVAEFSRLFGGVSSARPFIVGQPGAQALVRALCIDKTYVSPDVVETTPGDEMEIKYFGDRTPSDGVIDAFVSEPGDGVLMVLGSYGSGKSALAAHTLLRFSRGGETVAAAYLPLRDLKSSDEIHDVARRCLSTLRSVYPRHETPVLILDGLDELPNAMDVIERKRNILNLLRISGYASKVIITVRLSYFRGLTDFWSLFQREAEGQLWDKLSRHIPGAAARPALRAVILREFNTDQIREYVERFGRAHGKPGGFASSYMDQVRLNDLDGTYEMLQRNPLYLYLLIHTEPWNDGSVRCFADVIEQFMNYWLERDMEKGPSRWLLSTTDRKAFIAAISWHLFQRDSYFLGIKEFDEFVRDYFMAPRFQDDIDALALDLQTTGLFSAIGNTLTFALRAYGDYFVARRFMDGFRAKDWPLRLPDAHQTRMWIGLLETRRPDNGEFNWAAFPEKLSALGVDAARDHALAVDVKGILCGDYRTRKGWPTINELRPKAVRTVLNSALNHAELRPRGNLTTEFADEIRPEIVVILRFVNKLGLHARASAKFVNALSRSVSPQAAQAADQPCVTITRNGRTVDAFSIMAVMMLAASVGSEVEMCFFNCRPAQVLRFLELVLASPEAGMDSIWLVTFGEEVKPDGRIEYRNTAKAGDDAGLSG